MNETASFGEDWLASRLVAMHKQGTAFRQPVEDDPERADPPPIVSTAVAAAAMAGAFSAGLAATFPLPTTRLHPVTSAAAMPGGDGGDGGG
jgi:hypothetical protein